MEIKTFVPAVIKKITPVTPNIVTVSVELLSPENELTGVCFDIQCPPREEYVEQTQCAVAVMLPTSAFNNKTDAVVATELFLPGDSDDPDELVLTGILDKSKRTKDTSRIKGSIYYTVDMHIQSIQDYSLTHLIDACIPLPEYPSPDILSIRITHIQAPVSFEDKLKLITGRIIEVHPLAKDQQLCMMNIAVNSLRGFETDEDVKDIWIPFHNYPEFKVGAPIMFTVEIIKN